MGFGALGDTPSSSNSNSHTASGSRSLCASLCEFTASQFCNIQPCMAKKAVTLTTTDRNAADARKLIFNQPTASRLYDTKPQRPTKQESKPSSQQLNVSVHA